MAYLTYIKRNYLPTTRIAFLLLACALYCLMYGISAPAIPIEGSDTLLPFDSSRDTLFRDTLGAGSQVASTVTLKQALEKINSGHIAEAIQIINDFLKDQPDSAPAHELLGAALALMGNLEGGLAELQRSVALDPKQYTAYTKIGDILLAQGKDDMAKRALVKAEEIAPDDRRTQQRLGLLLEKEGKIDQAIDHYEKGIKGTNAGYLGVKINLARLYNQSGAFDSAKELLEPALAAGKSHDAVAQTILGTSYLGLGMLDQAIRQFEAAKVTEPSYEGSHLGLGIAYRAVGQYDKSVIALGEVIKLKPKWSTGYFQLGESYFAMGRFNEAAEQFEKSAELSPHPMMSEKRMADAQAALGNLDKAIAIYGKLTQIPPVAPLVSLALGNAYQLNGQIDQARKTFQALVKSHPKRPEAYLALGEHFGYVRDYGKAITTFQNGLKIAPKHTQLLKALSIAYIRVDDYDHAIQNALALVETAPDNLSNQILLASFYDDSGNFKAAEERYRSILDKDSKSLLSLNNLAMVLANEGKNQEAVKIAKRALELAPDNPHIMDTYGWTLIKAGKPKDAILILQSALSLSRNNPTILYHLAAANQLTGDKLAAKKHAEEALSFPGDFKEAPQARKLLEQL